MDHMYIDNSGLRRSHLPGPHGDVESYECEIDRMIGRSKLKKGIIYVTVMSIIVLIVYLKLIG